MSKPGESMDLRVLHVTNWYPSSVNPVDGIWIKRQIESLPSFVESDVLHIKVEPCKNLGLVKTTVLGVWLQVPVRSWLLIELISFSLIIYCFLFKANLRKYDLINFHIAYPLCVFLSVIRFFVKIPMVINEHWSAYHYNFGVKSPKKLSRIKAIFKPNIRIIAVSQALSNDIQQFVGNRDLNIDVVPNVVDTRVFQHKPVLHQGFLMAGFWKYPKDPVRILKAFERIRESFPDIILRIAGQGPLIPGMKLFVEENDLDNHIVWLNQLTPRELATEMQRALAFVHVSDYETFSVVCAEAICCGTPVIASAVGGIPEFINDRNGHLITDGRIDSLTLAIKNMLTNDCFDRVRIADEASHRFNPNEVGMRYYRSLMKNCGAPE